MTLPIVILMISNVFLIAVFVIFLLRYKSDKEKFFSVMDDFDIIEFQESLKLLVEEVKRAGDKGVKDIEKQRAELDTQLKEADMKIKELKYLLERNQMAKYTKFKEEKAVKTRIVDEAIGAESLPEEKKQQKREELPESEMPAAPGKISSKFSITESAPDKPKSKSKGKYEHVGGLLKQGVANTEIAKMTGLSMAEIDLIKNMSKNSKG